MVTVRNSVFSKTDGQVTQPKPWYQTEDNLSLCIAAYQGVGASDFESSKINLANPGTYNLTKPVDYTYNGSTYTFATPKWIKEIGWSMLQISGGYYAPFNTGIRLSNKNNTLIVMVNANESDQGYIGAVTTAYAKSFGLMIESSANIMSFICGNFRGSGALQSNNVNVNGYAYNNTVIAANPNGIWINGVKIATVGTAKTTDVSETDLWLGTLHYPVDMANYQMMSYLHGVLMAASVHTTVLTEAQIQEITNKLLAIANKETPTVVIDGIATRKLIYESTNPID